MTLAALALLTVAGCASQAESGDDQDDQEQEQTDQTAENEQPDLKHATEKSAPADKAPEITIQDAYLHGTSGSNSRYDQSCGCRR